MLGDRWHDRGVMWQATNLNKRDVTLDLGSEAGRELLLRLCATADVFVENFAVRVLDRLGLTYDVIREINPRMIMLRLPGFGLDGPWRDYVGFGDSFEQIGGLATVTGYPDEQAADPGQRANNRLREHIACGRIGLRSRTPSFWSSSRTRFPDASTCAALICPTGTFWLLSTLRSPEKTSSCGPVCVVCWAPAARGAAQQREERTSQASLCARKA